MEGFKFQHEADGSLSLESAVYQALGYASVCWSEGTRGIFEEGNARDAATQLLALISLRATEQPAALLGLATTGEMLDELRARGEVNGIRELQQGALALISTLPMEALKYRTVDE